MMNMKIQATVQVMRSRFFSRLKFVLHDACFSLCYHFMKQI